MLKLQYGQFIFIDFQPTAGGNNNGFSFPLDAVIGTDWIIGVVLVVEK